MRVSGAASAQRKALAGIKPLNRSAVSKGQAIRLARKLRSTEAQTAEVVATVAPVAEVEPVSTPQVTATVASVEPVAAANMQVAMDTAWVLLCGYLVIFMNAGFACLESGMCRAKNCVNILAKNLIVFALAVSAYYLTGFGLMFGDGTPFMGTSGFALTGPVDNAIESVVSGAAYTGVFSSMSDTAIPLTAKFFFQAAFAGTAATIVSGAVAERIKFGSFW